jgi:hypothetical protein
MNASDSTANNAPFLNNQELRMLGWFVWTICVVATILASTAGIGWALPSTGYDISAWHLTICVVLAANIVACTVHIVKFWDSDIE